MKDFRRPVKPFALEGSVRLEGEDQFPADLALSAYAFDDKGALLGQAPVTEGGTFKMELSPAYLSGLEVLIAPTLDAQEARRGYHFREFVNPETIARLEGNRRIELSPYIPGSIWHLFRPRTICVTGRIMKQPENKPVPFVKVEIFDVDRRDCWWDLLRPHLPDFERFHPPVIDLSRLLKRRPFPIPPNPPDPPFSLGRSPIAAARLASPGTLKGFDPQPDPPNLSMLAQTAAASLSEEAISLVQIPDSIRDLTITSIHAPWLVFPGCFYRRELVCETTTDCDGYYTCCFRWYPFRYRHGRFSFDYRPDLIMRITQVIDGVETVVYADPYNSTRWNVSDYATINLSLDDPRVIPGDGCTPEPPDTPDVYYLTVGADWVSDISKTTGLYNSLSYTNVPYGAGLEIFAEFGAPLRNSPTPFYYRLSYSLDGLNFTAITTPLSDVQHIPTSGGSSIGVSTYLGPQVIGTTQALYQMRSTLPWNRPTHIGTWYTPATPGTYILRLEVFDSTGAKVPSSAAILTYYDAQVPLGTVKPVSIDQCDLIITVDNSPLDLEITTPTTDPCGFIPWNRTTTPVLSLTFGISVQHPNNRILDWSFNYVKGANPTEFNITGNASMGTPLPSVNTTTTVSSSPAPGGSTMIQGLTSSCAYAVILRATPYVRNGYGFFGTVSETEALAIDLT
jgi:hypothetical protein